MHLHTLAPHPVLLAGPLLVEALRLQTLRLAEVLVFPHAFPPASPPHRLPDGNKRQQQKNNKCYLG